jgi:hypothetical protein
MVVEFPIQALALLEVLAVVLNLSSYHLTAFASEWSKRISERPDFFERVDAPFGSADAPVCDRISSWPASLLPCPEKVVPNVTAPSTRKSKHLK